jgi:type IV secretion system protein VirD4
MNPFLIVIIALIAATVLFVRCTAFSSQRVRRMRWRIKFRMRPGQGFATLGEVHFRWSRWAAVSHGKRARPGTRLHHRMFRPASRHAVYLGRAQYGLKAFGRMEDHVVVIAPPRSDKSGALADRVALHPGPVLVTSTRHDMFDNTAGYRARLGPVQVFNPEGVGGIPSTFGPDLLAGCQDPATVIRRADALVGPRSDDGDLRSWQDLAAQALAMFMHAAATLPGCTIYDVWQWAHNFGAGTADDMMRIPGVSHEILAPYGRIQRDSRTSDSIKTFMAECMSSWIAIPEIARLISPPLARPLDVDAFTAANGTMYLITASADSPCAPIFRVIAAEVHYMAGLAGSRGPHGRLDPPLLMALDEVCQICPVPLPSWLSDSAGKGILVHVVCHGTGQLKERYGEHGASTIWTTCGTKVFLPGLSEAGTLSDISDLCDTIPDGDRFIPACTPGLVRTLPDHHALVVSRNCSPLVVRVRPIWHRLRHRLARYRLAGLPALPDLIPVLRPQHIAGPEAAALVDDTAPPSLTVVPGDDTPEGDDPDETPGEDTAA